MKDNHFVCADNVNVLGATYSIKIINGDERESLGENGGICECFSKELILNNKFDGDPRCVANFNDLKKKVLRHEIVHAYCFESGVDSSEDIDSELVTDWIAHQSPKMFISFLEAGALSKDTLRKISDLLVERYDDDYNLKRSNIIKKGDVC